MLSVRHVRAAGAVLALFAFAHSVAADEIADFYKGKTVSIVVGHQVGTGFDIYARAIAPHLSRYIPGNPTVIVQNMVGASGITAVNWLANVAPKDGTVMATFVHTVAFEPVFGNDKAQYDPAKLNWIGSLEVSTGLCGVTQASGIANFEELLTKEAIFGATGATGPLGTFAQAVKNLIGAKLKVVYGYKGSADVKLAMNRGEVQGICGLPLSTIKIVLGRRVQVRCVQAGHPAQWPVAGRTQRHSECRALRQERRGSQSVRPDLRRAGAWASLCVAARPATGAHQGAARCVDAGDEG